MNIRKIIKEELIKEVGGYDDQRVMAKHAGTTMGALSTSHNDLTNLLSGLANSIMDGANKNDISDSLMETSKEINFFIDIINGVISEVMEDDVIVKAKETISSLKVFKRKIDKVVKEIYSVDLKKIKYACLIRGTIVKENYVIKIVDILKTRNLYTCEYKVYPEKKKYTTSLQKLSLILLMKMNWQKYLNL